MVSPPSSPTAAAAEPPPSTSTITDGAVSGTLPAAEAFAVHYPGYPSSPARAAHTLGGLPAIAKAWSSEPGARFELRFRPEDPYCHPAFGESRASTGLVLRLSRRKGDPAPRAEVVARVRTAYHFEGMSDYQHVVPVHATEVRKRRRSGCQTDEQNLSSDNPAPLETDDGDIMMLVPPLFSLKDKPTKIALLPSSNAVSKSMQRGVVHQKWEMDVGPTLALPFNIQAVPGKINWEDHIPKNSADWDWQMAVCKLFDERPVWPKQSLYERLHDDGMHVSQNQFRRLLFRAGYYFSTGPFGKFWIRRGYDPRRDTESRIFQRIDFRMPLELRNLQMKKDSRYSESLYALFSLGGVFYLFSGANTVAMIMLALSGSARSNGALNAGYFCFQALLQSYDSAVEKKRSLLAAQVLVTAALRSIFIFLPFFAFQACGYLNICVLGSSEDLRPWCKAKVPLLYSFIQSNYWGVGFLRYFQVKQLPNFLLASPVLSLAVYSILHYTKMLHQLFQSTSIHKLIVTAVEERLVDSDRSSDVATVLKSEHPAGSTNRIQGHPKVKQRKSAPTEMSSASLDNAGSDSQNRKGNLRKCSILLLPFVLHLVFMTLTAFFVMHVQVSTRFLSASPPIYWAASQILGSPSHSPKRWSYLIYVYFTAYILLGSLLFSNFYPFT